MPGSLSGEKKGKRAALDREKLAFAFFIALIIVFNVLLALRHESWRDEAQAWLMAKNLSFTELFKELSYEGHPCLWFLVLMPFAKLGLPYMTVKLVSTVLIAAVLILIACFAPVSRAAKMLIAASPACLYAFSAIGRVYALCAVLIILLALVDRDRMKRPFLYGALLALLVQTHVVMIGFVFALSAAQFFETLIARRRDGKKAEMWKRIGSLALPLSSAIFLLWELRDVANAAAAGTKVTETAQAASKLSLITGTIDMAKSTVAILFGDFRLAVIVLGIVFTAAALTVSLGFIRQIFAVLLGAGFQFFVYANIWGLANQRQYLLLYLLIWYVWTAFSDMERSEAVFKRAADFTGNALLILASAAAIFMGFTDAVTDYDQIYTDAAGCAAYIESLPADVPVFEGSGEFCNAVIANLKERKVYSAFYESEASYTIRDMKRIRSLTTEEYLDTAEKMFPAAKEIYVFYYKDCAEGYMGNAQGLPETYEIVYESPIRTITGEEFRVIRVPLD